MSVATCPKAAPFADHDSDADVRLGHSRYDCLGDVLEGALGIHGHIDPVSALDPLIRRELQDELMRLQAGLHKTMIFVTHDFSEAAPVGPMRRMVSELSAG